MGRVRAAGFSVLDSFVVEVENILSVSFKRSDRSEFLRIVFSPKAVGISKVGIPLSAERPAPDKMKPAAALL